MERERTQTAFYKRFANYEAPIQCHAIFHCAILFSYAIIWSTQRVETGELPIPKTEQHVSAILRIAIDVVRIDVADCQFIVFPVLVAESPLHLRHKRCWL